IVLERALQRALGSVEIAERLVGLRELEQAVAVLRALAILHDVLLEERLRGLGIALAHRALAREQRGLRRQRIVRALLDQLREPLLRLGEVALEVAAPSGTRETARSVLVVMVRLDRAREQRLGLIVGLELELRLARGHQGIGEVRALRVRALELRA